MITAYFVSFFGVLVAFKWVLSWKQKQKRKYNFPPGPLGIPLLGSLLQIVKSPHLKLSQWAEQYGSIFTIYFGRRPVLVLSDVNSMKHLFSQQVSTGKFKTDTMLLLSRGPYGIVNTDGPVWAEQRQFCLRNLVKFGFGKKSLEPMILSECQNLIDIIKEKTSSDTDQGIIINQFLKCATNNTLMTIVTGERVALKDRRVSDLVQEVITAVQLTVKTGLGFFPFLKHIAPVASGFVRMDNATKTLHQFIEEYFQRHQQTNVADNPRDLIDAYLDKMKTTEPSSSFYGPLGKINSIASVAEIFEAGSETTSGVINWLLYYMALYPSIQHKVHQELDSVLGGRDPSLEDKGHLPFMEAVILEVMRKTPVVPFGLIHELLADVTFQEYHLPRGMLLIANIYQSHNDKILWQDPENFRPQRFLESSNLKELLVPFQIGKRSCLGEPLAKDLMFLLVAKLLQQFEIQPASGISAEEYLDPDVGLGLLPKPRKIVMKPRSN